ncbi:MAG: hypothetical protein IM666_03930 [Phenylobacterium sp.]|uniref:hypothetical protein n=1 Tax=Phenylobacterium sp. TaxID=1871053 RepID=UPI0025F302E6|nr:hypothetical protein [Phenylobacterium sp.]MCA6242910.1 hypothetical protein [Phenylobacterium sp.]
MSLQDEEFRRQSDRTVDNLRSLYAILFALSLGLALTGTYDKVHAALIGQSFDAVSLAHHGLVTLSFLVTLSLFHYQTDRYMDVTYRGAGLLVVRPPIFLLDLVRGLLSMAPIYLMAQSLGAAPFQQVGFTWYVLAASLFLLSNTLFLSWAGVRGKPPSDGAPDAVAGRIEALRVFWLLLNSACMVLLFAVYRLFRSAGEVCPARGEEGLQVGFVAAFCLILIARDMVDISQSWPVLHPADPGSGPVAPGRLLTWLERADRRRWIRALALVLVLATVILVARAGVWDILAVTRNCMSA